MKQFLYLLLCIPLLVQAQRVVTVFDQQDQLVYRNRIGQFKPVNPVRSVGSGLYLDPRTGALSATGTGSAATLPSWVPTTDPGYQNASQVGTVVRSTITGLTGSGTGPNVQLTGHLITASVNNNNVVQPVYVFDTQGITWAAGASFVLTAKAYPKTNTTQISNVRYFVNDNATPTVVTGSFFQVASVQTLPASTLTTYTNTATATGTPARYIHVFIDVLPTSTASPASFALGEVKLTIGGTVIPATGGSALFNGTGSDTMSPITEVPNSAQATTGLVINNLSPVNQLTGKRLLIIGDSYTAGFGVTPGQTYGDLIAARNSMTYINKGISGTTLGEKATDVANSMVNRYLRSFTGTTGQQVDYIVVFGGTNDPANSVAVTDNAGDAGKTTTIGALKVLCVGLQTEYPEAKILFVTPILRGDFTFYEPWANACITIPARYGIASYDAFHRSGFNSNNSANQLKWFQSGDPVHLNTLGHLDFSYQVERALLAL